MSQEWSDAQIGSASVGRITRAILATLEFERVIAGAMIALGLSF
jgi:hypothetical protein